MANKFDCAILVLHHTRKGGDLSSAEAIGRASAIVNLSQRAIMAAPMTAEEATKLGVLPSERFQYFKVVPSKSNLAPRSDDVPWYRLCSVTLPNAEPPTYSSGDRVQAVERVTLPMPYNAPAAADDLIIKRAIADTVDRGKIIGGQSYPYSPNVTGAKNERALIDDAVAAVAKATAPRQWQPDDLRAVVARSITRMKTDGWFVEGQISGPRFRRGRTLRVDWSKTPWSKNQPDSAKSDDPAARDERDLQGLEDDGGQWVNEVVND